MLRIGQEEIDAATRVIKNGAFFRYGFGGGGECVAFEKELAEKMGKKHALTVSSGTAALICGLAGLGIGPGDEVIVPGYTFISTALAPLAVGAIPIICDVDESLTMDAKDLERKITPRTKVAIPVHMMGLPANMDAIMRVARRHKIKVLEDSCQADGGSYKGRRLGAIGDVGAYSFNVFKTMSCGEGGAVVMDDLETFGRALIHHDGGCAFWPHGHELPMPYFAGWNFRVSEIQGAIMRVQLMHIDGVLAKSRANKKRLVKALSGHPKLRLIKSNDLDGDCGLTIGFLTKNEEQTRAFIAALAAQGIGASTPIDSGRHVYCNWDAILEKRGSYHPGLNAYNHPANRGSKVKYSKDMCPKTLDILRRTVYVGVSPRWKAENVRKVAKACVRAAGVL